MRMRPESWPALLALAIGALAWGLSQAGTGIGYDALYLVPPLMLMLPLLAGRYPGEQRIASLGRPASSPVPRRTEPRTGRPRAAARLLPRGGALLAGAMAVRPPPALPALS